MSVNVENMRKWVARLRDPEAKQARNILRQTATGPDGETIVNGMCCLGHACDVSGVGSWNGSEYYAPGGMGGGHLPIAVMEWLGLDERNPRLNRASGEPFSTATWYNDTGRRTLAQIADLIEQRWPEVKLPTDTDPTPADGTVRT